MSAVRSKHPAIVAAIAMCWLGLLGIAGPSALLAADFAAPELQAALTAIAEGRPRDAVTQLDAVLDSPAADQLPAAEKLRFENLRLEALVRARDYRAVLDSAPPAPVADNPDATFWIAMAQAGSGQLAAAADLLAALGKKPGFRFRDEAQLTRAHLLQQLGDESASLAILDEMSNRAESDGLVSGSIAEQARLATVRMYLLADRNEQAATAAADLATPKNDYFLAWIALNEGRAGDAIAQFRGLLALEPGSLPSAMKDGAHHGLAHARLLAGEEEIARGEWIHLLDESPESALSVAAMTQLNRPPFAGTPVINDKLEVWRNDDSHPHRQGLAVWHRTLAQLTDGDIDRSEARAAFESFLVAFPNHEVELQVRLQLAEMLVATRERDAARAMLDAAVTMARLPDILNQLDYLRARVAFDSGDLTAAISLFRGAVRGGRDDSRAAAELNVALARLYADVETPVKVIANEYTDVLVPERSPADLLLERGLHLARRGSASAFEVLSEFIQLHQAHPNLADAELALAELHLNQIPPKPVSAREHLEAAKRGELTIEQREKLDHVAIWIEDSAGDEAVVIELAKRFLSEWPESQLRATVIMKLGETHYERGEFSAASQVFQSLSEEQPESIYGPVADFFAAKSASQSLDSDELRRAVALWNEVVLSGGEFAAAARYEEGLLNRKLGDTDAAIASFRSMLDMQPPPADDLRFAAQCDIGQAWFARSSQNRNAAAADAGNEDFVSSMASFDAVMIDPTASAAWKLQASVRKAKCLEIVGQTEAALDIYRDILEAGEQSISGVGTLEAEEWYFRAGFGAVRLHEAQQQWQEAVAIASRLARGSGTRSVEAGQLADRLRLEHFVWDR